MIDARRVTKLITHDSCADGLASAMIVLDALPHVEIVFAQYGTPSLEALEAEPGLLFCDITPPRERAAEFVEAGAIVLDHHKHARDIVERFGERGVFGDLAGTSGAPLAYDHVWEPLGAPRDLPFVNLVEEFALLVGIRDTWLTDSPEWERACDLHAALMALPRDYWLRRIGITRAMSVDTFTLGKLCRAKRAKTVAEICESGTLALTDPAGRVWAVFPDAHGNVSDVAEALRQRGVAVTCGWFQVVEAGVVQTVLSLRSDGSLDVGALAKRFGGGGHARAAGCRVAGTDPLLTARLVMREAKP